MKFILISAFVILNLSNSTAQAPTWSEDISCIFYSHCTNCHNPGGIAPFSLLDYNQAYNFRYSIQNAVETGYMPPWKPNPHYQSYAHQRNLSQQEIDIISAWVNADAPEGDPTLTPPSPIYTTNYEITNPDTVLKIPDYTVPILTTNDMYRCFVIPTNYGTEKFISAIEVDPGNDSIVHHVLVFYDTSSTPVNLDLADPGPGYTHFGDIGSNTALLMGGWVPGSRADFFPAGMGVQLPANSYIILQIHYPVGSTGKTDSTSIRLKYSNISLRPLYMIPLLEHTSTMTDGPLVIPPNTVKTFHNHFTTYGAIDGTLIGISPHAHLICKSMNAFGVKPNGDTIPFIDIPNWDFHWQGIYYFQRPIHIPLGTQLFGEATYDNTSSNPHNPNNPPNWVFLGEDTQDEMMLFFFTFTYYLPGDENLIIDTTSHQAHYLNCTTTHVDVEENTNSSNTALLYPNPIQNKFTINLKRQEPAQIIIQNIHGQMILRQNVTSPSITLLTSEWQPGIYIIQVKQGNNITSSKVVKM